MPKLLFFVLVFYLFISPLNGGQVASATEFWFDFLLVQMACSSSNHCVFVPAEVGTGSDGEERVIVQYLEYGANVGPSAPRTEEETVIDIDPPHFKTTQSSPYVGEARNNSSPKVDGVDPRLGDYPRGGPGKGGGGTGGGGGGPGGGAPGGGGGGGPGGGGPDGDELDLKELHKALKKLAKASIFISAQTGTALLSVAGSTPKSILYSIVAINVCSYVFCMFSFLVSESKPLVGVIMSAAGSLLAALGFLLTMCLIIPPEFIPVLAISTIFLLLSLSALSF